MKTFVVGVLFWLLSGSFAVAQSNEDVMAMFDEGRFKETVAAGRALGTSEGLTLALRGQLVLIQYLYQPQDRMAAIERAIEDGRQAVALDPENVEAKINLGIIIGLRGKPTKSMSDGNESRALFEEALEMEPDNSWALGTVASWHAETLYQGGFGARIFMGARKKIAWALFEQAIEVEPGNLTIRAAYIRAMLKLKPKKFATAIREHMDYILAADADNMLEQLMQEQIRQIDLALASDDKGRLELLLDEAIPLELVNNNNVQ